MSGYIDYESDSGKTPVITVGSDKTLSFQVSSGVKPVTPVDISGWTLRAVAKANTDDIAYYFDVVCTITDAAEGEFDMVLTPADLPTVVCNLIISIYRTDGGKKILIVQGTVDVHDAVTI